MVIVYSRRTNVWTYLATKDSPPGLVDTPYACSGHAQCARACSARVPDASPSRHCAPRRLLVVFPRRTALRSRVVHVHPSGTLSFSLACRARHGRARVSFPCCSTRARRLLPVTPRRTALLPPSAHTEPP